MPYANVDDRRANWRRYTKTSEYRAKYNAWRRAYRKTTGRAEKLWQRYRLTVEDYDTMLAAQEGRCGICRTDVCATHTFLSVDHDHATGVIRGLLCHSCNVKVERYEGAGTATGVFAEWIARGR